MHDLLERPQNGGGPQPQESGELKSRRALSARLEPFDSYWQAPDDVEKGYSSFGQFYRHNYLRHMPKDRRAAILVVSCGPGYFLNMLAQAGYTNVLGIDSYPEKVAHARRKGLSCQVAEAFPFLEAHPEGFDLIYAGQELNHLTKAEMVEFLALCWRSLKPGGRVVVYGLNGANPITGGENLAHNIDHFNLFTEYSLKQILQLGRFVDIQVFPLNLYVFFNNPLNYLLLGIDGALNLAFRLIFKFYGKSATIFSKKLAAVGTKGP